MDKKQGIFTISLDTELAWGMFDKVDVEKKREEYLKTREVIDELLDLFEKYNISATWAVVGHLFLDRCKKENGIKHPDLKRPDYDWYDKDWFHEDPATNIEENPIWYGKDILKKIKNTEPKQDIGSHSFSHLIYSKSGEKVVEDDLRKTVDLAEQEGVDMNSFVFPRNEAGHLNMIKKFGFKIYRCKNNSWFEKNNKLPESIKKIFRLFEEFLSITPPVAKIKNKSGLIEVGGSQIYRSYDFPWNFLSVSSRIKRARKGIDKVAREGGIYHLWFHPFNLVKNKKDLIEGIEEILKYAHKNNEVEIMNMKDISKNVIKN